jgi:hypothetical protein
MPMTLLTFDILWHSHVRVECVQDLLSDHGDANHGRWVCMYCCIGDFYWLRQV